MDYHNKRNNGDVEGGFTDPMEGGFQHDSLEILDRKLAGS